MSLSRSFRRQQQKEQRRDAVARINSTPKPPVIDGVCACGCCHVPDRGACPQYLKGANNRCVICDHSVLCHRRKGEKPPRLWNMPVVWHPKLDRFKPNGFKNPYRPCPECNAPAMFCPSCNTGIPIKEAIETLHTGTCPKCGAVDAPCPGKPKPKEPNEPTPTPDRPADAADPAAPVD